MAKREMVLGRLVLKIQTEDFLGVFHLIYLLLHNFILREEHQDGQASNKQCITTEESVTRFVCVFCVFYTSEPLGRQTEIPTTSFTLSEAFTHTAAIAFLIKQ